MKEINNFLQEPDESLFHAWERFKELLMKCPQHYLIDMQEFILFYNGLDVPTRQILDSRGAIPIKTAADAKVVIQEMAEYSQKWHNGTSSKSRSTKTFDGLAAIDQVKSISTAIADLSEIRRMESGPYVISIEVQGVNILGAYDHKLPQKEKDPGSFTLPCFINNVCFDKALIDLGASVSVMPFSTYTNLGLGVLSHTRLTIELADRTIKRPWGIAENVLVRIGKFVFLIDFIILDIPEDDDIHLILG
ncbi:hypothetical protein Tco_0689157 [Tanacetum coccineum]